MNLKLFGDKLFSCIADYVISYLFSRDRCCTYNLLEIWCTAYIFLGSGDFCLRSVKMTLYWGFAMSTNTSVLTGCRRDLQSCLLRCRAGRFTSQLPDIVTTRHYNILPVCPALPRNSALLLEFPRIATLFIRYIRRAIRLRGTIQTHVDARTRWSGAKLMADSVVHAATLGFRCRVGSDTEPTVAITSPRKF